MSARRSAVFGAVFGAVLWYSSSALAQPTCPTIQPVCTTALGRTTRLIDAKPGVPGYESRRKFDLSAKEKYSTTALVGDPAVNGAFVQILVFGVNGLQT